MKRGPSFDCEACGAPLWWLGKRYSHRPIEREPSPTYEGCQGLVYDRRTRALRWVHDLAVMPAMANMVHACPHYLGRHLGQVTPDDIPQAKQ